MARCPLIIALAFCAFAAVAASAGAKGSQEQAGTPAQAAKPATNPAPVATPATNPAPAAKPAAADDVVARVYGESITEKQVLAAINQMAQRRQLPPQQMQQRDALLFKDAVDTLVGMALLKNEAKTEKLTVAKEKVDETYQGIVKGFPSEAEFKKALDTQGMTEASLRVAVEDNLINQLILDSVTKGLPPVADADVQKFYDGNPRFFERPEQVHASHILLQIAADATPEQKAETMKKLEAIRADIESKKVTFAEAASKYSEDKNNAAKGGDLGFISRGQTLKSFEDAAFTTKPGSLSPVVETQSGYHLISVSEVRPAGKVSMDEAKKSIQGYLENQEKQTAIQKYIDGLRAKTTVEILISEDQWKQRHPSS